MRNDVFRMDPDASLRLLADARVLHLATTTPDGTPVLRALHAVLVDSAIVFHGAQVGEKASCAGRRAVIGAEEVLAEIPSWFVHPEDASAAGTLYRSAQAHGTLLPVEAPEEKVRLLEALMAKYQPEGRYRPLSDPFYEGELARTLVLRMPIERLDGKAKLAQNRTPEDRARLVDHLSRRGRPGDAAAIEAVRAADRGAPSR